ncbi:alkaline phosphatase-like protein [Myriangium duriaei CBS 260.36]|uniref:GPI ethanolamine phosphate transferase 2 n=1 Tax=Myriangium duriaei CBS 260.36 TaxID=1168546 RepID=A0A9P4JFQ7_9PEZI|nr:alkaline phosphatase-like protein [Myriangium duriaei CBS 260.36]
MAIHPSNRLTLLVVANLLIPLSCLIFATGFFPYKPLLPGLATFKDQDAHEELELLVTSKDGARTPVQRPNRMFNKVVLMVVDALRSDFVYGAESGFNFTQGLIRSGAALPFTAYAAPPTVTMPRIKALTTGSVPSFADLILNFAESDTSSSLVQQDTWLAQIKAQEVDERSRTGPSGKIVFYGDDTWLKLFPDFFIRWDGTSSFFVSDFTEVDNNVTRHIDSNFRAGNWDAMIMHYLGLDHIGHKTGPEGPNMIPKQREMDDKVRMIFDIIQHRERFKDTLLILVGDHGMNSAGNHGGSSAGETSTAMLFASPKFRALSQKRNPLDAPAVPRAGTEFDFYTKIQQSDLVPSIAAALGLPIPKNNLGVIIPEFLSLWEGSDEKDVHDPYLQLLYRNSLQVLEIVKSHYGKAGFVENAGSSMSFDKCRSSLSGRIKLQCLWSRAQRMLLASSLDGRFDKAQQAEAILDFLREAQEQLSVTASSYNVGRLMLGVFIALTATIIALLSSSSAWIPSSATFGFSLLTVLYSIMMFASSYVEEEQHIWYWMTGGWLAVLTFSRLAESSMQHIVTGCGAALLVIHRVNDRWNQTGQKWAGEPDIAKSFFTNHYFILWVLVAFAYFQVATSMASRTLQGVLPNFVAQAFSMLLVGTAYAFKLNFTYADSPELVGNLLTIIRNASADYTLLSQARTVFGVLGIVCLAVIPGHFAQGPMQSSSGSAAHRLTLAGRLLPPLQLLLLTQTRVTNAPLFFLYSVQFIVLPILLKPSSTQSSDIASQKKRATVTATKISLTVLLLTYASYFQTGGSNAISSIDLSNAYNGVASYNITAVGVLLFISNWAGPMFWTTAGVVLLQMNTDQSVPAPNVIPLPPGLSRKTGKTTSATASTTTVGSADHGRESAFQTHYALATVFTAASLAATMVACTVLRTHLFIWTVFSPKFLYAVAWSIGWHVVVGGVWAGGLWWAG